MPVDLQGIRASLPLAAANRLERTTIKLGDAVAGGIMPVIIAGPCAVEDLGQLLETARRVKTAGAHGLRGGAFKPRSSPYSFQGLGGSALEILAAAKVETGLFLTVEVVSPADVELVADYADLLQVGARNMQNFALLRAVGQCRRPVLLKRGLSATIQEWLQAAEYILAEGNAQVILCERGIRTFEPLTRNTFDLAAVPLVRNLTHLPVFVDPSHATGRRELVAPMTRAALAAGADGVLIEVHPNPAAALSDGEQSLTCGEFAQLMRSLTPFHTWRLLAEERPSPEIRPSAEEFYALATQGYRHIPLYCQFAADELTPVAVYRRLVRDETGFLLESVEAGGTGVGRYSFCGDRPRLRIEAKDGRVTVKGPAHGQEYAQADVLRVLEEVLAGLRVAPLDGLPRFYGGAVGYLGYNYVYDLEPVPRSVPGRQDLPDACWVVPERLAVIDHVTQTITLIVLAEATQDGYTGACSLMARTLSDLRAPAVSTPAVAPGLAEGLLSSLSEDEYCRAVGKAKDYIADGEIFQIVLSQQLNTPFGGDALSLYRALRAENPSPYLFLLNFGRFQIIGSSPETMVRLEGTTAEVKPVAGTRPRGPNDAADLALEAELRADVKECAEHIMLVDLGRNNLGRVCRYGTVAVPEMMKVERFSRVMHLVSRVTGELMPDENAFSLLRATFPAGTLTGAPKVRAMQIIAELEPCQRGIYGGAAGYIGFNGNLDTCIIIRTVILHDGRAVVQAGAGIVADSDPPREYAETLHKASAVLNAVRRVREGCP